MTVLKVSMEGSDYMSRPKKQDTPCVEGLSRPKRKSCMKCGCGPCYGHDCSVGANFVHIDCGNIRPPAYHIKKVKA